MGNKKIFLILLLVGVLATFLMLTQAWSNKKERIGGAQFVNGKLPLASPAELSELGEPPQRLSLELSTLPVSAEAILLKDYHSGAVLFQKNIDKRLPIASLTKIMTALLVNKKLSLEAVLEIEYSDTQTLPFRGGLVSGEKLTAYDLLGLMLVGSANDATLALARSATSGNIEEFVTEMNREALALQMVNTHFANPVGFDDPRHYSTASDLGKLVEEFLKFPKLLEIVKQKSLQVSSQDRGLKHSFVSTNKLLSHYPEVVGLKTGYTEEAKGNLALLVDLQSSPFGMAGQYYGIILGSGSREADGEKVINWVRENFRWEN